MSFWRDLFGLRSNEPYFKERSDAEAEGLLLEAIRARSLNLGDGIVHSMRMPWEQARRVIDKLRAEGKVNFEIPHNTWITTAHT